MTETLYPKRSRCKACRKSLNTIVIAGMYCSYQCGKFPKPAATMDATPRHCKREVNGTWGFKTKYASPLMVPEKYTSDPATNVYLCDNCKTYHIGHSRSLPDTSAPLKRYVNSYAELGSVVERFMDANNISKKDLAATLKVPMKRITEIHQGSPAVSADLLFKVLNALHIRIDLTGPPRKN